MESLNLFVRELLKIGDLDVSNLQTFLHVIVGGFAAELESAAAFFKTMDEIDLKEPYPPEAA